MSQDAFLFSSASDHRKASSTARTTSSRLNGLRMYAVIPFRRLCTGGTVESPVARIIAVVG